MIDTKYIELIHKDIDKEITPQEKEMLVIYLKNNPDAQTLYQELIETENLIDAVPDMEASEELKKRILNSINYNRYADRTKTHRVASGLFRKRKPGFILSFSLGLIAGIVLLAVLISNPALVDIFDQKNVSGTMGLVEFEKVEVIDISAEDLTGTVEIIKGSENVQKHIKSEDFYTYGLTLDLSASEDYEIEIQFDPSGLTLDRFISAHPEKIRMYEEGGILRIASGGSQTFSVLFSSTASSGTFDLKIIRPGTELFERKVLIKN